MLIMSGIGSIGIGHYEAIESHNRIELLNRIEGIGNKSFPNRITKISSCKKDLIPQPVVCQSTTWPLNYLDSACKSETWNWSQSEKSIDVLP